ncbi:hypothetical protein [Prauserella cavernicola]|uniref:Uncharacterized protein n=1 Tax=Prauserella cavernicola TaxID=2800127 RepID=A0A934QVB8_9PSEU|nr:hypothetical protein [Prauserella cavernicola]MBK1787021.1 hypothetical protein [Prauserella cavernicola]
MAGTRYEFRVEGRLSEEGRSAFPGMRISEEPPQTIIDGDVVDDAQLHGILAQLQALGVMVVSARPVPG